MPSKHLGTYCCMFVGISTAIIAQVSDQRHHSFRYQSPNRLVRAIVFCAYTVLYIMCELWTKRGKNGHKDDTFTIFNSRTQTCWMLLNFSACPPMAGLNVNRRSKFKYDQRPFERTFTSLTDFLKISNSQSQFHMTIPLCAAAMQVVGLCLID